MRSVAALLAIAFFLGSTAAPASACACGGFVSSDASASPGDELALVHWDGRTETLIMQLALESNVDDAALVVPTPTPAVAASASPAVFEELRAMTAPRVNHAWQWWPGAGAGPDAAGARGGPGAPTALAQVQLGPIEATTLTGGDLDGLTSWLTEHGYVMRSEMLASLEPYTREGWSFVAMRLTSSEPIDGALDPVKLTFDSDRLVYPMRMSAAAREGFMVRLYAVSEHRLQRTDPEGQYTTYPFAGWVTNASDADLAEMIGGRAFLTEMSVTVYGPSQITSDFTFERAPQDTEFRTVVTQTTDVSGYVMPALFALIVIGAVIVAVFVRRLLR